jgi:hypothetical protein
MVLSQDLITKFAKIVHENKPQSKSQALVRGIAYRKVEGGIPHYYVRLDGSNHTDSENNPIDIPADISQFSSGARILDGDGVTSGTRVIVLLENRTAYIIASLETVGQSDTTLGATANYITFADVGLVIADMRNNELRNNLVIGVDSVKIRDGKTVNATFSSTKVELLDGAFKIGFDENNLESGFGIYGKSRSGIERLAFQPVNENGNTTLGWGNYAAHSGNTNVYGNDVHIGVSYNDSINETFRPYYRKGDSFTIRYRGAGYVTTGGKDLRFSVPVSKPIIGSPIVSVTSKGFILRQGGKYTHGSSSDSTVKPSSIAATCEDCGGNFIRIDAVFGDTTNVVNNDAIGIDWEGTITFK